MGKPKQLLVGVDELVKALTGFVTENPLKNPEIANLVESTELQTRTAMERNPDQATAVLAGTNALLTFIRRQAGSPNSVERLAHALVTFTHNNEPQSPSIKDAMTQATKVCVSVMQGESHPGQTMIGAARAIIGLIEAIRLGKAQFYE